MPSGVRRRQRDGLAEFFFRFGKKPLVQELLSPVGMVLRMNLRVCFGEPLFSGFAQFECELLEGVLAVVRANPFKRCTRIRSISSLLDAVRRLIVHTIKKSLRFGVI